MQNEIAYSRPVTLTNILKFAVPTIAMSVFMSFYTMVDGLFVSNLIGTSALSALNLVYPVIALVTAISTMLATGGSAAIMRKMGEGKPDEAKQDFTFLILVNVLTGLVMCGLGYLFMGKIFGSMSLSPEVSAYCWEYLSRYLLFTVPILLMNNFTLYMIAAGKASLSLLCSVAGGVTNIVLDYLFIAVFRWGIGGAAVATGLGYSITAIVGLLVFSNRNSLLHFVRPVCRPQTLGRAVTNGHRAGQRHHHADVQLDDAQICRGGRRCRNHHHLLCAGLCRVPVCRLCLRGGPHAQLLLRGTEP